MTTITAEQFFPCGFPKSSPSANPADDRIPGWADGNGDWSASSLSARAYSELARLLHECGRDGWDGYAAKAISVAACERTLSFMVLLPSWIPAPEITPESDGEIELGWYVGPVRSLSISIGSSGPITYAGLFGNNEEVHGVTNYVDCVPKMLLRLISDILPKDASRRAA